MANLFEQASKKVSNYTVVMTVLSAALLAASIVLIIEDFNTSLLGWQSLPIQGTDNYIVGLAVAALPQLFQVVGLYVWGQNTKKAFYLVIVSLCFVIDTGTDTWFRMYGEFDIVLFLISFPITILIFTIGSEFLFTIALGILIELLPNAMVDIGNFINRVGRGSGALTAGIMGGIANVSEGLSNGAKMLFNSLGFNDDGSDDNRRNGNSKQQRF